jgi:exodeoxyribonuclease V gamma subunit
MAVLGGYEVVHPQREIEAWVDPLQGQRTPLAAGGLGDSLLRTLQSDLLQRPTAPTPACKCMPATPACASCRCCTTSCARCWKTRASTRRCSPADCRWRRTSTRTCRTRSGVRRKWPWRRAAVALADASPLAGEPLAEVFLRLLDLPIARFGLDETLDPLASAHRRGRRAGRRRRERLHGWLRGRRALGAGCRASRRAGRAAGRGLTWQFALDRLLLGHASGGDADVAGVAAWPELEGSALAALDTLIRCARAGAAGQATRPASAPPRSGASAC